MTLCLVMTFNIQYQKHGPWKKKIVKFDFIESKSSKKNGKSIFPVKDTVKGITSHGLGENTCKTQIRWRTGKKNS